jgi:hypothetical protein
MIWIAVGTVALAVLESVRNVFAPPDWVVVRLENVPLDVESIYVVADTPEGPWPLRWYHEMVGVWTDDPRRFGEEWNAQVFGAAREGDLQWVEARRHGILARKKDGTWLLWWLGPGDRQGPSVLRYLVRNGTATLRVPDDPARAEAPSEDFMRRVGLPPKGPR